MCWDKNMFVEIEAMESQIYFGDSSKILVKGKGKILIFLKDGTHQFIPEVYYVPDMKSNILSLGQLLEKGFDIHMKDRKLTIKNNSNELIAQVEMIRNIMVILNIKNGVIKCLKTNVKDPSWLWHTRLGHLNFEDLNNM
ncbi:5'-3' exoribonuclease 2 [Dendrobium catenatum]|uniref:5'-3' exoribonuclease 2 n=1 Tax=Dendrobium catenatum TaxID=906689 RepID=A0A2I0W643_9ASPA|nr:5'-3' exoribonuclease 2 [Dendrobium catenatum]